MKTIVIDPGHGGYDAGASYNGRLEKDDNLRLGLAVRDRLLEQGQRVIMTRSTDVYIPLLERSSISNNANADMFVSLHRNANANYPNAYGVENYIQNGSPENFRQYAKNVLDRVVEVGVQGSRGVLQGNYSVLRNTRAPSMLLEMGYIHNDVDNKLFDCFLNDYAEAITRGILESLGEPYRTPSSVSDTVRRIQATLNSRYNTGLKEDGIPGPSTKRALVIGLQTELNNEYNAGLTVDGVFGPRTRSAIRGVRLGARGNMVYLLQAALYMRGYPVDIDGVFGVQTENAVKQFQSDQGLVADGIAGANTFNAAFT